jgi:hypothetical protein
VTNRSIPKTIIVHDWQRRPRRLDFTEYAYEKGQALARVVRRRSLAQELVFAKRIQEITTFRIAIRDSAREQPLSRHKEANNTLAVARAAQATLVAEESLAAERIAEAEFRLRVTQEEAEEISSKRQMADLQVGGLLNSMTLDGLRAPYTSEPEHPARSSPAPQYWPRLPYPPSELGGTPQSDNSDFQSYYDPPESPE